jgi:hypothetical protein
MTPPALQTLSLSGGANKNNNLRIIQFNNPFLYTVATSTGTDNDYVESS